MDGLLCVQLLQVQLNRAEAGKAHADEQLAQLQHHCTQAESVTSRAMILAHQASSNLISLLPEQSWSSNAKLHIRR